MPSLSTKLNARSADFKANADAMRALIDDLNARLAKIAEGGGEAAPSMWRAASCSPATASKCCWTPAPPSWRSPRSRA
jgi:hypothetical protein